MDNNSNDKFNTVFNNLTLVKQNSRNTLQDCDLFFNEQKGKNGKFIVSDFIFTKLDLNNNGFLLLIGKDCAFVGVVPNDEAITYTGRLGATVKAHEFTSTQMKTSLDAIGITGNKYWLKYAGTKDNIDYYEIVNHNPKEHTSYPENKQEIVVDEDERSYTERELV